MVAPRAAASVRHRANRGVVCIEPGAGGRVFESFTGEAGEQVREMGRTLVWDPPHRLVLLWRAANFAPHEQTEVEVQFRARRRWRHDGDADASRLGRHPRRPPRPPRPADNPSSCA